MAIEVSGQPCPYCCEPGTMIDWRCPGCRARMLAACPDRLTRQRWLARWRYQGDDEMVSRVVEALKGLHAPS